jgi:hypothetical protein
MIDDDGGDDDDDDDDCGAVGGMSGRENQSTHSKSEPMPLWLPQIPHKPNLGSNLGWCGSETSDEPPKLQHDRKSLATF